MNLEAGRPRLPASFLGASTFKQTPVDAAYSCRSALHSSLFCVLGHGAFSFHQVHRDFPGAKGIHCCSRERGRIKATRGQKAGSWRGAACYLVRVLEISFEKGKVFFRVQHLYKRSELTRDLQLHQLPSGAANELWLSPCQDTYEPESILSVFTLFHHKTVGALYPGQSLHS